MQASSVATGPAPLRFVTSTALYDGHDAAINVARRLLLDQGAEVIHLGHNRGVEEIVRAALQEDADAIAVSSYQGGHIEFFRYLIDSLKQYGGKAIRVFGGGGGTITPNETRALEDYGAARIYTPEDVLSLGLEGMAGNIMEITRAGVQPRPPHARPALHDQYAIGQTISCIEQQMPETTAMLGQMPDPGAHGCPVIGVTGPGGAGKSSLIDELLSRFFANYPDRHIAYLTVDPTRHSTGGAMLGDRIRINSASHPHLYLRSIATRRKHLATSATLSQCVSWLQNLGFDLLFVETAGTGQGDSEITDLAHVSIYIMTSEFGAPTQLEKIEMLNYADFVVLNKSDRQGALDALGEIRKQWRISRREMDFGDEDVPIFSTRANRCGDAGIDRLFAALCRTLSSLTPADDSRWAMPVSASITEEDSPDVVPPARSRYLAEIGESVRSINRSIDDQARAASEAQAYYQSLKALADPLLPDPLKPYPQAIPDDNSDASLRYLRERYTSTVARLSEEGVSLLLDWPKVRQRYTSERYSYVVRGQEYSGVNYTETLSHSHIPKIALPRTDDWGQLLRFLMHEHLPGHYPFTAGVYPYRRTTEDPTRMFAGEGLPERTNRRFHFLAKGQKAVRLSTAFDPVALYGDDPDARPDVYGCIGMSGVSVATLDDFKRLYSGFDLCQPHTSVSMTINGPGPIALACFITTAIDQQIEKWLRNSGQWPTVEQRISKIYRGSQRPCYRGPRPPDHDGLGLGLLGISGQSLVEPEVYARIRADTLSQLRGTLQADILKEDQAQNECLFPIEFALRLMADVQAYIIDHDVRNYYSVSVSGYHIAEAGANPITQLAFTLANGFTLIEYFLSRGMQIDDIAPHLSFFFSNGLDAEYAVIGRVARRIWALALRERYHAKPRSQQLKYHIQTSGRSLHTREPELNDIRTTLQALYALCDNCNSLHTNAFDEAVTTPTEASVRRAVAIQMIINREFGLGFNENSLQGAFIIEELTDRVEEAVLKEFDRLSERGGVLAAMEGQYQRRRIQEESLYYEKRKHDGSLPVVGVNTFVQNDTEQEPVEQMSLVRSTDEEKRAQIADVAAFKRFHAKACHGNLARLKATAGKGENVFSKLLNAVQTCTLGQITQALYEVAGRYRRNL